MIGAARSVGVSLLAVGVIAALVALCSGCALGASAKAQGAVDSSTADAQGSSRHEATATANERQTEYTREKGSVTKTTVTPVLLRTPSGGYVIGKRVEREKQEPEKITGKSAEKGQATSAVDDDEWARRLTEAKARWQTEQKWHFNPSWGANLAMAGAGLAALAGLVRYGPALWNFVKGKVGL